MSDHEHLAGHAVVVGVDAGGVVVRQGEGAETAALSVADEHLRRSAPRPADAG